MANNKLDIKLKKIKLISLTPIKFLHIIAKKLKSNIAAELLFAGVGVILTIIVGLHFIKPYDESWKYAVSLLYVTIVISFEVLFLMNVWNKFQSLIVNITSKGNVEYNKCRDELRRKTKNFSMGLDEKPKEPIDYFLKKDKGRKMFVYVSK